MCVCMHVCMLIFATEVIQCVCVCVFVKRADKGSEGQYIAFSFRGEGIVHAAH